MRHAVSSHESVRGHDGRRRHACEELLDPTSSDWIGADPDAFIVQSTLL